MSETPGLYERLAQARAEFQKEANFSKVKTDKLQYAYLPIESAKPLVEKCTSMYSITILPMGIDMLPQPFTFRDEKRAYITAKVMMRIACPEDYIDLEIMAEAADYSDKCINKVYTMAYKNLIKILFGFSESAKDDSKFDDPRQQDNDYNQEPVKQVPNIIRPKQPPAGKYDIFNKPAKPATQSTLGGGKQ